MELCIIIINWNGANDTIDCLLSLENLDKKIDIYILDNGSQLEDKKKLRDFIRSRNGIIIDKTDSGIFVDNKLTNLVLLESDENFGFAIGNNYVVGKLYDKYKYILLLNNDTIVPSGTIEHMLNTIKQSKNIALTCDIRYESERHKLWNAGGKIKWYGDRKYFSQRKIDRLKNLGKTYISAEFITGCALMIDCHYIAQFGLFTDKFFHGEEDYNFCYRAKKNKVRLGVDLSVQLFHKVGRSISRGADDARLFKSLIVHYTNRLIDYKSFYGSLRWRLWRNLYLLLMGIKRRLSGFTRLQVKMLRTKVRYYSQQYDNVKKDVFQIIMQDNDINSIF